MRPQILQLGRRIAMASLLSSLFGGGACASSQEWPKAAAGAEMLSPGQVDGATAAVDALPSGPRAKVNALLERMAAQPPGVDGLKAALDDLDSSLPSLVDGPQVPGGDPVISAAKLGAMCVLQGLVLRSGQAVAATAEAENENAAVALLEVIGSVRSLDEGQRTRLLQEARMGLGPPLYLSAWKRLEQ